MWKQCPAYSARDRYKHVGQSHTCIYRPRSAGSHSIHETGSQTTPFPNSLRSSCWCAHARGRRTFPTGYRSVQVCKLAEILKQLTDKNQLGQWLNKRRKNMSARTSHPWREPNEVYTLTGVRRQNFLCVMNYTKILKWRTEPTPEATSFHASVFILCSNVISQLSTQPLVYKMPPKRHFIELLLMNACCNVLLIAVGPQ